MKSLRVTYLALGAFVFAASCSKEAAEPDVYDWVDGEIYFKPSLADVARSRGQDMTLERLNTFQVTCFNYADKYTDDAGYLYPYFENATFIRKSDSPAVTTFVSSPADGPCDWPANEGFLRFFAFNPSPSEMAEDNSGLDGMKRGDYFNLINTTIGGGETASVGYRLGKIRINPDISHQFDFVTAEASGTRRKDFAWGVDLAFRHQLCQVELKAWGAGNDYDFEIAGVRIGNPTVEGTYVFADDASKYEGEWENTAGAAKDKVEYIYRGVTPSGTGNNSQEASDRIFRINSLEHNTPQSAGSLMGQGGCAMVIPTVNPRWEGLADPNISSSPYRTDRMYFSILTRVTDTSNGTVIYPYPENANGMEVVSYSTDAAGNIIRRLYAGKTPGTYFTDPEFKQPYEATEGLEIKDFGWAAVPVDADWSAGKRYIFTLNYSEGIGLHDPADPEPGKPIGGKSAIQWGVQVTGWNYAEKDENYDPDMIVP